MEKWKFAHFLPSFACFQIKQQFLWWCFSYAKCGCIHLQQYEYIHVIQIFRLNSQNILLLYCFNSELFSPPSTTSCIIIAPPPQAAHTPPLHPITILLLKWRRWWCNNSVNDDNILSGGNSIWGALIAHFGYGEGGVGGCVELMGKWPELQKDRDLFNYTRGESSFHYTHPTVGNNTVIFRKVGG